MVPYKIEFRKCIYDLVGRIFLVQQCNRKTMSELIKMWKASNIDRIKSKWINRKCIRKRLVCLRVNKQDVIESYKKEIRRNLESFSIFKYDKCTTVSWSYLYYNSIFPRLMRFYNWHINDLDLFSLSLETFRRRLSTYMFSCYI